MSKILITGMSAPQTSLKTNLRSLSFAGLIHDVLTYVDHQVVVCDPKLDWTVEELEQYSAVIVGVSPITSLSANKAYGALGVIDHLWDSPKLRLMVDAPHPAQIGASLRSINGTPNNLIKPFYSYRQGYQLAATESVSKRLLGTVERLLNDTWPETIYPSLPWRSQQTVADELPVGARSSLNGINLDWFLIPEKPPAIEQEKVNKWVADMPTSNWTRKVEKTLAVPVVAMRTSKAATDVEIGSQISRSVGSLISPHRDGTWWTYRYIQSLTLGVPVATDWKESQAIGSSWAVLPATIEHMNQQQRTELAWNQLDDYASSIPKRESASKQLEDLIGLHAKTRKEAYAI